MYYQVFITNGWHADVAIVCAITNKAAKSPAHGISLFLVSQMKINIFECFTIMLNHAKSVVMHDF